MKKAEKKTRINDKRERESKREKARERAREREKIQNGSNERHIYVYTHI
jgi:hypothetical protein